MTTMSRTDLVAIALILLLSLVNFLTQLLGKIKKNRQTPQVYDRIDDLMHRSSEEGKSLLIGLGEGLSGMAGGIGDLAGLMVERALVNRVVFNDQPAQSFSADGALACISQLIVHGAYENALASELFRPEYNQLTGINSFIGLTGMLPEIARSENAGMVLIGSYRPENVLVCDLAERQRIPLIVASSSLPAQATFFPTSAESALGEDYFLPSVGRQEYTQESLSSTNSIRVIITAALVLAALLKLFGVLP